MKPSFKKIFLLLAVVVTAVVCFCFSASALESEGQCGDNMYWSYNADTKELVISGEGDMYPFYNFAPYDSYKNEVKKIVIEDGVTGIGDYAFWSCENLVSVDFADSVVRIGESAFSFSPKLNNVVLPLGLEVIGSSAFGHCRSLNNIKIPDSVKVIGANVFYDTAYQNNEKNWEKGVLYIDNHLIDIKKQCRCVYY